MSHIKQNITEVTILEQHQYIKKILGIQISENLQETITLNWQNNLKKRKIYTKNVHQTNILVWRNHPNKHLNASLRFPKNLSHFPTSDPTQTQCKPIFFEPYTYNICNTIEQIFSLQFQLFNRNKYTKNDFSYNHIIFFAKFCNSIEKGETCYKYNNINSILLVGKM